MHSLSPTRWRRRGGSGSRTTAGRGGRTSCRLRGAHPRRRDSLQGDGVHDAREVRLLREDHPVERAKRTVAALLPVPRRGRASSSRGRTCCGARRTGRGGRRLVRTPSRRERSGSAWSGARRTSSGARRRGMGRGPHAGWRPGGRRVFVGFGVGSLRVPRAVGADDPRDRRRESAARRVGGGGVAFARWDAPATRGGRGTRSAGRARGLDATTMGMRMRRGGRWISKPPSGERRRRPDASAERRSPASFSSHMYHKVGFVFALQPYVTRSRPVSTLVPRSLLRDGGSAYTSSVPYSRVPSAPQSSSALVDGFIGTVRQDAHRERLDPRP